MQETHLKYQAGQCPRCGGDFICRANNISSCECMQLTISKEEQSYISSFFLDCVCNKCLKELKYEFYLKNYHNKPIDYDTAV